MKACTSCGEEKAPEAFGKAKHTKDGLECRCLECRRKQNRAHYAANKERYVATRRAWYEKNREKHRERTKARRKASPEKQAGYIAQRRAREREQTLGRVSYEAVLERDGLWCYLCGQAVKRSQVDFDHVLPIARGGPHSMNNIRVTHRVCNRRKGTRIIEKHMTAELLAVPLIDPPDRRIKTHCPQGHSYEGENLIFNHRGARVCRTCRNDKAREYQRRKKGYYERRDQPLPSTRRAASA